MFNNISDHELVAKIRDLVGLERRVTRQLLHHIGEMEIRRCYAPLGFSSVFDFLTRELGYSESAAWRRLQAARLLRAVPEASAKIDTGEVNLTTLAQTQTAIKAEEKRTGEKLTTHRKAYVLAQVESCSSRQVERSLNVIFPDIDRGSETKEIVRSVDENKVRAHVTFTRDQLDKLERLKEILSHRNFGGSLADVIEAAADELLERMDPLRKIVQPRTKAFTQFHAKRFRKYEGKLVDRTIEKTFTQSASGAGVATQHDLQIKPSTRNFIHRRDRAICQFVSISGIRCGKKSHLEIDHIVPRAKGGGNELENLRLLCKAHNFHAAEIAYGKKLMNRYRKE